MAEVIKSLISSITTRFNGNSSVPHDHQIQSKLDGHPTPIRSKPDFSLTDEIVASEERLKALFELWLSFHDLSSEYRRDRAERFELFKESARRVHEKNKQDRGCTFGLNEFSAMTDQEMDRKCFGHEVIPVPLPVPVHVPVPVPVRNQREEDSGLPWNKWYSNE